MTPGIIILIVVSFICWILFLLLVAGFCSINSKFDDRD